MQLRRASNALVTWSWTGLVCSYVLIDQTRRPDAARLIEAERTWASGLLRGWGVEVEAEGVERVPSDRACVLMANHQSHSDVVALFAALRTAPVFLAKMELRSIPLFGAVMERAGHVFIDRGKHSSAVNTIDDAALKLRPGQPLLVFPEGTRGRAPEIARFKKGGFHLARKARVPVVPIGIRGSRAVWPRESQGAAPGRISIHVGELIEVPEICDPPIEEVVERVRRVIASLADLPIVDRSAD